MWDGDEPGPHILYGDLLTPYLVTLLNAAGSEMPLLRAFDFLEQMARSEDQAIRDVRGASVLEGMGPELLERAEDYMGIRTKELARGIKGA